MKNCLLQLLSLIFPLLCVQAQDFPYGGVLLKDLTMTTYERDTTAGAVVLKEFGQAFINNGDGYHLIYKYHVRIKVLNKNGLKHSNIEIPLYKQGSSSYEG